MFLNILKILASNVLKMLLNIIVGIGCTLLTTVSANKTEAYMYISYSGQQERMKEI